MLSGQCNSPSQQEKRRRAANTVARLFLPPWGAPIAPCALISALAGRGACCRTPSREDAPGAVPLAMFLGARRLSALPAGPDIREVGQQHLGGDRLEGEGREESVERLLSQLGVEPCQRAPERPGGRVEFRGSRAVRRSCAGPAASRGLVGQRGPRCLCSRQTIGHVGLHRVNPLLVALGVQACSPRGALRLDDPVALLPRTQDRGRGARTPGQFADPQPSLGRCHRPIVSQHKLDGISAMSPLRD
jgi:hypothetical protein